MAFNKVYVNIPKNFSRKQREDMKTINKENDVLIMDELLIMKELL